MEKVLTVGGNRATRPLSEFARNIAGTCFYVGPNARGAGDDGRSGRSKETSLATLEAAIALATASKNDIIYLLPGHTETIATAGAISLDKIGLRIIGLGSGALRPTFTFSDVASTMTITAASCVLENVILTPSVDSVVSPLVISAPDCKVDIEIQDASAAIECVAGVLTTAAAERLDLKLKYRGFIAGNACVNAIRLVGVDTARIDVDFYGVASTSVVEFHTTACHDVVVSGKFYNSGTSLTKNVVDTVGTSTWSVTGWDGNSNANFSGGDNAAIASDDAAAIAAAVATAQADLDILTGATGANLLTATQNSIDAIETDTGTTLPATLAAMPQCVVKADGAYLTGLDPLFTISGGPVRCKIVGLVTTVVGGATSGRLQHITTDPAATVELNAGAVACDTDPAGTFYYNVGDTSVFTPSIGLGFELLNPVTIEETEFLLAPGVVQFLSTAAQTGVIAWYMTYEPLSPLSVVTATA